MQNLDSDSWLTTDKDTSLIKTQDYVWMAIRFKKEKPESIEEDKSYAIFFGCCCRKLCKLWLKIPSEMVVLLKRWKCEEKPSIEPSGFTNTF